MIIVAGHVVVDPPHRDAYLAGSVEVVKRARAADGCLDFFMSADLVEPGRINIVERWRSREAVDAFRGTGPADEQAHDIRSGDVREYVVTDERTLMS